VVRCEGTQSEDSGDQSTQASSVSHDQGRRARWPHWACLPTAGEGGPPDCQSGGLIPLFWSDTPHGFITNAKVVCCQSLKFQAQTFLPSCLENFTLILNGVLDQIADASNYLKQRTPPNSFPLIKSPPGSIS